MTHVFSCGRILGLAVSASVVAAIAACSPATDFIDSTGLHHCSVVDPQANETAASWADALRWENRTYEGTGQPLPIAKRGALLGHVTCDLSTSGLGAGAQPRNGDATVPAGSSIYSIVGMPDTQMLAVVHDGSMTAYVARS